ncbi:hypothetical protein [Caballeronia ptereochthonis]|uniref:Uncharacterized protein n=1 Tax=Caballeronia ptereochthonis TaxID=1777144 RepID=A0A157ZNL4_9BURK|nr:hypothetical protein [Caballeronia ptereochthonis]SAK47083.1 hypothetical protein AWB83_00799 [Caballeronia ptereochthonis]
MNAIPQPKTHQIVDRINALQAASPRFIDASGITPLSREWRAIRHEIDQLMRVDACAAWELMGSWRGLEGDIEGAEAAFRNSRALGQSDVSRENWMITRLNLGLFSAAQEIYRELTEPQTADFMAIAQYGVLAGAIGRTAQLIKRARATGFEWDDEMTRRVMEADSILIAAHFADERIARHLDTAGSVLRRHRLRASVVPHVTSEEGVFRGVTYLLNVPVSFEQAHDMNFELVLEDVEADNVMDVAFDVHFAGVHA